MAQVAGTGVQLAVGKCPGAALAELDVALRIQLAGGPETLYILLPLLHALSPLQQNGACAAFCQHQRGKQSGRPLKFSLEILTF